MPASSRPSSLAAMHPSLQEILANTAPPPWNLSAFMAYLSQNHCLETLEFTLEAERYRLAYEQLAQDQSNWTRDANDHVCILWQRLMNAYILPCGPREVNLPGPVRDQLLSFASTPTPPNPSELEEAVRIVHELMNDSVLLPFIASTNASQHSLDLLEGEPDSRQGRARLRMSREMSSQEEPSRSPKLSLLPNLHIGRRSEGAARSSSSSSADAVDREGTSTDESSGSTPPPGEPLTPPTTPPTSDWGFGTSPGSLQRAISAHSNGWKRMSAKLGLGKKSRTARRANTSDAAAASSSGSTGSDVDVVSPPAQLASTTVSPAQSASGLHDPEAGSAGAGAVDRANQLLPIEADSDHDDASADEWEGPHPGQRLSLSCPRASPALDFMRADSSLASDGGVCSDDMAAKYRPSPQQTRHAGRMWLTRRSARARVRNTQPGQPVLRLDTRKSHEAWGVKGKPIMSAPPSCPHGQSIVLGVVSGASSAQGLELEEGAESLSMILTDPDVKTEVGTTCSSCETEDAVTIKETSPPINSPMLDFTDFSNHLGIHLDSPNGSCTTVVNPSANTTPVEAEGDAYGWEAELDRRQCCIISPTSNPGSSTEGHARQPCVAKRSLLHRVLSSIPPHRPSADHTTAP
ncbi:hypothetical protein GGTG_11274 [Gaeumannomyces tritici R3-111a-1]|uniref:RGS domain-containing protein n=1 Tax=Gaeumannomyces tritici (strain R3-111a-1) TaxID=644352 RepID=J3PCQ6_GAET3|nr:hypothetical protein GGTG_11274 [Gaeumannomyces tritici R3-111a-1]EJT72026.1 hypothetical protein GGTG_11274 [Gaeumannomyces tritici R3-111a-1]